MTDTDIRDYLSEQEPLEFDNILVSIYQQATTSISSGNRSIAEIIEWIADRRFVSVNQQYRDQAFPDGVQAKVTVDVSQWKASNLKACTPSGVFNGLRRTSEFDEHSGLVVFDLDTMAGISDKEEAEAIRDKLSEYAAVVFLSPSNFGVKPIFRVSPVPSSPEEHTVAWKAVLSILSRLIPEIEFEDSKGQSDVTRLCFMGDDPGISHNEYAPAFLWQTFLDDIIDDTYAESSPRSLVPAPEGYSKESIDEPGSTSYPDDSNDKVQAALDVLDPGMPRVDWIKVGQAIHDYDDGETGFGMWDDWSRQSDKHNPELIHKEWVSFNRGRGLKLGTLYHMADAIDKGWRKRYKGSERSERSSAERELGDRDRLDRSMPDYLNDLIRPTLQNNNDTNHCIRYIMAFGDDTVIAVDDPNERDPIADIYAVTDKGILSMALAYSRMSELARIYIAKLAEGLDLEAAKMAYDVAWRECFKGFRDLKDSGAMIRMRKQMPSAVVYLQNRGVLPDNIVIMRKKDLNTDLGVIGAPNGVIDLKTGKILSPDEGRGRYVTMMIADDFDPEVKDWKVDKMWPETPDNPVQKYEAEMIGWMLSHSPEKEALIYIGAKDSGKTAKFLPMRYALGDYMSVIRWNAFQNSQFASGTTAHDGDTGFLCNGIRLCIAVEGGQEVRPGRGNDFNFTFYNKVTGGEGYIPFRRVGEKQEIGSVTAGLIIQGNLRSDGRSIIPLQTDNEGDAVEAARERSKMIPQKTIPESDRNLELKRISDRPEHKIYRQAMMARLIQYCVITGDKRPDDIPDIQSYMAELRTKEFDDWDAVFLQKCLVRIGDDESILNSYEMLLAVRRFQEENSMTWKDISGRKITEACQRIMGSGWKGKRDYEDEGGITKRRNVTLWRGWELDISRELSDEGDQNAV